ncbi:MAG: Holliday junction resolvase RuvX [Candidatus Doudnabacteria bacterium]|nr:Holliday junction resolvase RuvX [Candidatus Doudnabacteria bacterium]
MAVIIGIDHGTKHIGLAISDETGLVAAPLDTITRTRNRQLEQQVAELINKKNLVVERFVIGDPLGLGGKPTQQSKLVKQFAENLQRLTGVPYTLWNETGSSFRAEQIDADKIHEYSAVDILQAYLDFKRSGI